MSVRMEETVTLSEAKELISALSAEQSLLLLSAPGLGKSAIVAQAAAEAGLRCTSLLGTQIAPEDVSGVPRIVGERSVFCPPRILLPETNEPFCLFLDELPACAPDIQKAFYSLLLERRIGEFALPPGTWVVAAGNRVEDRALVRSLSSALVNRVTILNVRVDHGEWLRWARANKVRREILSYITFMPRHLMEAAPAQPLPFCTPRAWAMLSRALDLVEERGKLNPTTRRALAFGRVSAEAAAVFCAMADSQLELRPLEDYVLKPELLPAEDTGRWFVLWNLKAALEKRRLEVFSPEEINRFLMALPQEHRFALLVDQVHAWGALGADDSLLRSLREVTGL